MGTVCLCADASSTLWLFTPVCITQPGLFVPKSQQGQLNPGCLCPKVSGASSQGVCLSVCTWKAVCLSQSETLLRRVMLLRAWNKHWLITPAACWTLLSDGLSTVPLSSVGCACNTSKVRETNFSLYCTLAVFSKIANPTLSPSLQTPL